MSSSPLKPHIILLHNILLPGWARLPILIMENVEVSFRLLMLETADDAPELLLGKTLCNCLSCRPCCDLTRSKNAEHILAVSTQLQSRWAESSNGNLSLAVVRDFYHHAGRYMELIEEIANFFWWHERWSSQATLNPRKKARCAIMMRMKRIVHRMAPSQLLSHSAQALTLM
jgi:hypothetical protein